MRRLFAAPLLVLGLLVATAPAASAQEEETHETHCFVEAVEEHHEEAEETHDYEALNAAVEECKEAPNPLLPEKNEIIWGAIGFLVVFVFLAKFGFPAVKDGMNARAERIRNNLDEAERTKAEAQSILDEYQRQLAEAKNEAARIVEEARQAADAVRRDLVARAEAEVAELAIELAEKVVERSLDRETNMQLIENFINQVGTAR